MALTPGEGGAGGGSAGGTANSICAISPSDLVGTLGNLITRIEQLEFQLSQVVGANLHSEALSNISQQVGWVYGVEYMGIPGWTQTEYGTLIPPPGFTLTGSGIQMYNACTGEYEDYQAVVMDENGVLQFGATNTGNLCGTKVEEWNDAASLTGATQDYGRATYVAGNQTYHGWKTASRGTTILGFSVGNRFSTVIIQVSRAGLYLCTGHAGVSLFTNWTGGASGLEGFYIHNMDDPDNQHVADTAIIDSTNGNVSANVAVSSAWQLDAGDRIEAVADIGLGGGLSNGKVCNKIGLNVVRISN